MQVEKDIEVSLDFVNGKLKKVKGYAPVKLFPTYPLKCFKEYKLSNKNVLTKYNSGDEVLELLSHGANVTCYSSNRLDEYFLNLRLALLSLDNKEYFSYLFKDYGKVEHDVFSKETYSKIRENLGDKTKYFFDELLKKSSINILESRLLLKSNYSYKHLCDFVRYYLYHIYINTQDNLKKREVSFKLSSDSKIPTMLENTKFDFINLLYKVDNMDEERLDLIMKRIDEDFKPLLTKNGVLQGFIGKKDNELENYEKLEVRGLDSTLSERKNEYIYVYKRK